MLSITSFDVCIVSVILLLILLFWITLVLTRDRQDPVLKDMKKKAVVNGLISRKILGELVKEAIEKGIWNP